MKMLFLILITSFAFSKDLYCDVKVNTTVLVKEKVSLNEGEKKKFFAYDEYQFFVSQKDSQKYEIEVYNAARPSREYSLGTLTTNQSVIEYASWSRKILLESRCFIAH